MKTQNEDTSVDSSAETETPGWIENAPGFWPMAFALSLLVVGLAALIGCWIYGNDRGMIGGGFLAVVGAVLSLKK